MAIVTKKQLADFQAKYGADKDLTDYMNAQLGLVRRHPKASQSTNPQTASAMLANMPAGTSTAAAQALGSLAAKEQAGQAKSSAANAAGDMEDDGFATATRNMGSPMPPKDDGFLGKNMRAALGSQFKKGGVTKKYAKGGHVKSSASSRADGIAQKGHTKGRMR